MANSRTVDPTGNEPSTEIVGIRLTETQLKRIAELCTYHGCSRSELLRRLVARAYDEMPLPEPF